MIYILVSILAGVTIVISRIINSNLASKIGLFQSTFYNFLTGLLFSSIILLISRDAINVPISSMPLVAFLGGLVGVISVTFSSFVAPRISAFYMTLLIFIGQLSIGILIDYFTLNELSLGKVVGGIIVVIGLGFNLLVDKKEVEVN
jgi:transporter family-2 protein